ncbi:MAG: hypothetical protein ABI432_12890 [Flavobacteriales bacterium]
MRTIQRTLTILCLAAGLVPDAVAQSDSPFKEGTVYTVAMIRTEANSQDDYLKLLSTYYVPLMTKAKEQGLIKGFTLLSGAFANQEDFDVMMLVEYESMAMMDPDVAREAKWKAIRDGMDTSIGGKEKTDAMQTQFGGMRTYVGNKLMRKLELK